LQHERSRKANAKHLNLDDEGSAFIGDLSELMSWYTSIIKFARIFTIDGDRVERYRIVLKRNIVLQL
jgi:hypothetical protein